MIEADRVLSTPPLNSSLSRRRALAGLATLSLAPTVAAASAVEPDPVFALIAAKQAADVAHGNAIYVQDAADAQYGHDSQRAWDADEACGEACHRAMDAAWQLADHVRGRCRGASVRKPT